MELGRDVEGQFRNEEDPRREAAPGDLTGWLEFVCGEGLACTHATHKHTHIHMNMCTSTCTLVHKQLHTWAQVNMCSFPNIYAYMYT